MSIETPLNSKDAAKFLGLSKQTLINWRHNSKGPDYIKLGGAIRYRTCDLVEFLERNKIEAERSCRITNHI